MTKELHLPYQPEIKAWRRIYHFFTEVDLYQWLLGVCSVLMGFFSKLSWDFFKKKNNDLNQLEEEVHRLNERVAKIEEGMVVKKSNGEEVSLSQYVQNDVKHALDNNEKGIAGFMDVVLSKMNEKDEMQARINQQILIKLNQLSKNGK